MEGEREKRHSARAGEWRTEILRAGRMEMRARDSQREKYVWIGRGGGGGWKLSSEKWT